MDVRSRFIVGCSENSWASWNVESGDVTVVVVAATAFSSLAFTAILVASTVCVHRSADTTQDVLIAFSK
jgi:hypothetical protein